MVTAKLYWVQLKQMFDEAAQARPRPRQLARPGTHARTCRQASALLTSDSETSMRKLPPLALASAAAAADGKKNSLVTLALSTAQARARAAVK